jgi:GNAT superfamily N-acetyltransferase
VRDAPLLLRRAADSDHDVVIGLIGEAAAWLRTSDTAQWAQPWPSSEERRHRIRRDLIAGKTWIARDGGIPAATMTADPDGNRAWPAEARRDPAVYVCRLAVGRACAGQGLGTALLDWAGRRGRQHHRARWVHQPQG